MTRWVALLRGINVGGANRLTMSDLRESAASLGWTDVATYVQSGNLVFTADLAGTAGTVDAAHEVGLAADLSATVAEAHGLRVPVVVRSAERVRHLAAAHPDAGGPVDPKMLHLVFLDRVPDPQDAAELDGTRFMPDRFRLAGREVFVTYPNGSARSKLTIDVFERAWGVVATGRNLNTVRRLGSLVGD